MIKKKQNSAKNKIDPSDFLFNVSGFVIRQTIEESNQKVRDNIRTKNKLTQREKLLVK